MSEDSAPAIETESVVDVASRWFVKRRRRTTSVEEKQFRAWLRADPAHRRAYENVTRSWEISAAGASDPDMIAIRSDALMLQPEESSRSYGRWGAAAAAAALVLASLSLVGISEPGLFGRVAGDRPEARQLVLKTAVGHRTAAKLDDGSMVTLNTDSVLKIDYSAATRHVRLLKGEAFFRVAKDPRRPFVVSAGDRQVIALGTQFEVRLERRQVRVALLEGRVRVQKLESPRSHGDKSRDAEPSGEVLEPGEQLVATPSGSIKRQANVANLVSWRTGRIRFDDTPLGEAVAEMNRYSATQIVIAEPSIADIRISGSFRIGHSRSFSEVVSEAFPIEADVTADVIRLKGA